MAQKLGSKISSLVIAGRSAFEVILGRACKIYIILYLSRQMGQDHTCSWDDPKRETNLAKHGYDFADVAEVFDGRLAVTLLDARCEYGELRYNMLTEFRGRIVNLTFTPRAGKAHLISVRPASRDERSVYNGTKNSL